MNDDPQPDSVEQTIEKLLETVRDLRYLADKAIDHVENGEERLYLRKELSDITERHNNQY